MPAKPEMKQAMFKNTPAIFYTSDSVDGRFVAGYIKFPEAIQATMLKQIQAAPGEPPVRGVIEATIAEFAKGGKAKVVDPNFGLDRGLPAEFATLQGGKATLRIRVYLGSKATYIFITSANPTIAARYFDSIKLTPEIAKS